MENGQRQRNGLAKLMRLAFVLGGLAIWYATQAWIGQRELMPGAIGDAVHDWLAGANEYFHAHPVHASYLLVASSAVIDALGLFLLWKSIFGPSIRPFLGLLLLFAMRQICQASCALEPPSGMIWHDPGVPSLLVTYGVATDFFFSGHTGLAVLGAVELARIGGRGWIFLGAAVIAFEVMTVLVLRAHYTMDVFTGAVAARYASLIAVRLSPACDRWLGRMAGEETSEQEFVATEHATREGNENQKEN